MTASSGRCHGPGCTQTAVAEGGFCGEVCQARWHGQFDSQSTHAVRVRLASWTDPATVERLRQQVAELTAVRGRFATTVEPAERPARSLATPVDETHVWGAEQVQAAERLTRPEWQPALAKAKLLLSTSDASPQVAPENPQVASIPDPQGGWFRRWIDRLKTGRQ